jgi:hypothetical protein
MSEFAVDLLGVLDVVPEIGSSGLFLQLSHLSPQPVDVQHSLDPGESGGKILDIGSDVGIHVEPG